MHKIWIERGEITVDRKKALVLPKNHALRTVLRNGRTLTGVY